MNEKLKIVFRPGEERPKEYGSESEVVGVAVRTNAELENVYEWDDLEDDDKEQCIMSLLQWFDIEDFGEDPRVNAIVDHFCQDMYRRWRYTLAQHYRKDIKAHRDPRLKSPRLEVPLTKWLNVCDHFSSESFENAMIDLKNKRARRREDPLSDEAIIEEVLGRRLGYTKGIGRSFEVLSKNEFALQQKLDAQHKNDMEEVNALKEKLKAQEAENQSMKAQTDHLKKEYKAEKPAQQAREAENNRKIDEIIKILEHHS